MTTVDLPTMTEREAREFISYVRTAQEELPRRVIDAWQRRAWIALGYTSWDQMCEREGIRLRFAQTIDRSEAVLTLRTAGMSQRAIASAVDVSPATVNRDIASGVSSETPEPARTTGLDGKQYAPRQETTESNAATGEIIEPPSPEIEDPQPKRARPVIIDDDPNAPPRCRHCTESVTEVYFSDVKVSGRLAWVDGRWVMVDAEIDTGLVELDMQSDEGDCTENESQGIHELLSAEADEAVISAIAGAWSK